MSGGHQHRHTQSAASSRRRLAIAFGLAVAVFALQLVGGLLTGSLALLADAGHVLTDAAGVGLALVAATMAARPATERRTFGWRRLEVLAAAVNAAVLLAVGAWVVVEAAGRLREPSEVDAGPMLAVAVVGLVANAAALRVLAGADRRNLNVRGAYLEVLADLLGSVAVVLAALVVALTGFDRADSVVAVVIAVAIVPRTLRLLREAVDVLLEATPRGLDMAHVRQHILGTPGVVDVHDLHAWTITSGLPVLSAHVVVDEGALADGHGGRVLDELSRCLSGHFDVEHCTFQLESAQHRGHESRVC